MDSKIRTRPARQGLRLTEKHIAELLQAESAVSPELLIEAMTQKKHEDETIGEVLVKMSVINEKDLAELLATQLSLPYINAANYSISKELLKQFDPEMLQRKRLIPLDRIGDVLLVAFAGVMDEETITDLEQLSGCRLSLYVTTLSDVRKTISEHSN